MRSKHLSMPIKYKFYKRFFNKKAQYDYAQLAMLRGKHGELGEIRECYENKSTNFAMMNALVEQLQNKKVSACQEYSLL